MLPSDTGTQPLVATPSPEPPPGLLDTARAASGSTSQPDTVDGRDADIALTRQDGHVRLVLAGDIDATVKGQLSDALDAAAHPALPVEVDCSGVTFIDSTGLSALFWLANVTPEPPRLVRVPRTMRDLLTLTGMEDAFTFGL